MSEKPLEYRVMIHPSGDLENALKEQLEIVAKDVYGKETNNVIFRVKTIEEQTNPRKLFIPGDGEIFEIEVFPHITLGQKIVINESDESKVLQQMTKVASETTPFTLISTELGDYGEDFTIFLAFAQSKSADKLVSLIGKELKPFLADEEEKRDILHFTLLYDDVNPENINKAWEVISKDGLVDKKLPVVSLWLWRNKKGWKPFKEFKLKNN